jgi:hypothetical protein
MEGMFLQWVPVRGSLVEGVVLLALVVLAVVHGRLHHPPSQATHSR